MYFLWQQRERPTHFWLHLYLIFIHSSVDELVLCMSPRADANRKQASRETDGKPATLSEQQKGGWGADEEHVWNRHGFNDTSTLKRFTRQAQLEFFLKPSRENVLPIAAGSNTPWPATSQSLQMCNNNVI